MIPTVGRIVHYTNLGNADEKYPLEQQAAIIDFEPRIMKDSIDVRCVTDATDLEHHNLLALEIRGTLWSVPYPIEFILRSELDLESGHMVLRPTGGL